MRLKVKQGNSHNDWLAGLVALCDSTLTPHVGGDRGDGDGCCRWKKPTRIATNTALAGVRMWCQCRRHLQLRGTCPARRLAWAQIAEPYRRALYIMLAAAVCTAVRRAKKDRLNVSRSRPRRATQALSLEEVNALSAPTLAVQSEMLQEFFNGAERARETLISLMFLMKAASALPQCLRCYGDLMFQKAGRCSSSVTYFSLLSAGVKGLSPTCKLPGR